MKSSTPQQPKHSGMRLSEEMRKKLNALPPERRDQVIAAASKTLARLARKKREAQRSSEVQHLSGGGMREPYIFGESTDE